MPRFMVSSCRVRTIVLLRSPLTTPEKFPDSVPLVKGGNGCTF